MILYGAGGHGEVVFENLLMQGEIVRAVFDDDEALTDFRGLPVRHAYDPKFLSHEKMIISVGSNTARRSLVRRIKHAFGKAIDRNATVRPTASLGNGIMVMAGAIVQSQADIGNHVIVNTGAVVEHHVLLGDYVHVGPGAVVCGNVTVGEGALIGANATILPGLRIGEWAVIGAGSVVTKDVEIGEKVAGNPARKI